MASGWGSDHVGNALAGSGRLGFVRTGACVGLRQPRRRWWRQLAQQGFRQVRDHLQRRFFGEFRFSSDLKDGQYTLSGDAKLSALFGAFKWRGITKSIGAAEAAGPNPKAYAFSFDGGNKKGRIDMSFAANQVSKVTVVPPPNRARRWLQ